MKKASLFLALSLLTNLTIHAAEEQQQQPNYVVRQGSFAQMQSLEPAAAWERVIERISQLHPMRNIINTLFQAELTPENWEGHILTLGVETSNFGSYLVSHPSFGAALTTLTQSQLTEGTDFNAIIAPLTSSYFFASFTDRELKQKGRAAGDIVKKYAEENGLRKKK